MRRCLVPASGSPRRQTRYSSSAFAVRIECPVLNSPATSAIWRRDFPGDVAAPTRELFSLLPDRVRRPLLPPHAPRVLHRSRDSPAPLETHWQSLTIATFAFSC